MVIKLNEKRQCVDVIREILSVFYAHTFEEMSEYFPYWKTTLIENSLKILIRKKEVTTYEVNGTVYYVKDGRFHSASESYNERSNIKPALDFMRLMINSRDESGILVNSVKYISTSNEPHCILFECNKNLYQTIYMPKDECRSMVNLFNLSDSQSTNNDDVPPYRIVVVDSPDYFDLININKIKYKVFIKEDKSLIYEIGDGLC